MSSDTNHSQRREGKELDHSEHLGMKKKPTPPESSSTLDTEAAAPAHDPASREREQEAGALLQILELGDREIEAGQTEPAEEVIARLRTRLQQ